MNTERAIKPKQDGYLTIVFHNRTLAERVLFSDIKYYTTELFGLVIVHERSRRIIPWNDIRELRETFNSEHWSELMIEWMDLDHRHHNEKEPDTDCRMCLETMMSNSMNKVWVLPHE